MNAPTKSVIERLPFEQYCDLPEAHATSLINMLTSPRLYRSREDRPRPDSDIFRQGRAGHTAILEPDKFALEYAVWRKSQGIRRGKVYDAFCEANTGRCVLTEAQYDTALRMRDAVREHPIAGPMFAGKGRNELTLRWAHPGTGIACKARLDRLTDAVIDVKSCRDPNPAKFKKSAADYGYAMQLAFYRHGAMLALGMESPAVKIVAVQNVEPFDCVVFDLPAETLAVGDEQIERAMARLAECTASGLWPGIADTEQVPLVLPAWALPSGEDDEPLTFNGEAL